MGLFNTEYRCTCKQCSHVWHYTKSDEKEQKSLQKQAKGLQLEEAGRLITPFSSQKKAMQNLQRQQLVQSQTKELDRCPNCGSRKIKKEDSAFAPKLTSPQIQAQTQIQPEPQTPVPQTPTQQVQQTPPPPLPQTQAPYTPPQRPTQSVGLHVVLFLFTVGIGNIIYFLYIKNKQQQYDMSQSR